MGEIQRQHVKNSTYLCELAYLAPLLQILDLEVADLGAQQYLDIESHFISEQ